MEKKVVAGKDRRGRESVKGRGRGTGVRKGKRKKLVVWLFICVEIIVTVGVRNTTWSGCKTESGSKSDVWEQLHSDEMFLGELRNRDKY